ncbi:efflux RND transporter permease subunit [Gilvimarinus sp. SDUM040013]|uniref:Efflux RND transporter permease subunit n=1 Tax=Gilvimarinus gilvus TaxID=3058038 RepID=A0ABU4RT29_9GAMM|nr:efflux RND transporter permease subunit [Gilvimarinus sp. SDUM040013]MDO3387066.1 efflux RND transporter permease subunit [Gilvimarinus sp. SDUM040013]MDX6848040.1 efflux RND transporter permease subunit [Gilvimarinus sp. SDUM040013]
MESVDDTRNGIIAWFARNSVAANLLMICVLLLGLYTAFDIRKQMFPQFELNFINVSVLYRGAAPQDVEEAITVKLEEALASIQGIERIITRSNRGSASANIEVMEEYDAQDVLDEVKTAIDSISSFPDGMERPQISRAKYRQEVMYISLFGDLSNFDLKRMGEDIHDELRALPDVSIVDYYSGANYEIAIEVSRDRLYEYGLTFSQVADAVRGWSTNQSAGQIRAEDGYISVRVEDQAYVGPEFERLPLLTRSDGTVVQLGDVAEVKDGFEEGIQFTRINGQNSVTFFVGATKDQSITDVAQVVNNYIEDRSLTLPEGLHLETWVDFTYYLNGRLNMMLSNMFWGGLLVLLILALFLRLKLAMWVMLGLPVSFLGAIMLLPLSWVDVTINVGSLFAFIMVLGVVVDDAIVIGESVHTEIEERGQSIDNVIRGAQRVAMPATFGVLTTCAAFVPMVLETGPMSAFPKAIGFVVIFCLLFSLIESKLILPAHLAHMKPVKPNPRNPVYRLQSYIASGLQWIIEHAYSPALGWSLHHRYVIMAAFTGAIIITAGMFAGGLINFVGQPKVPHDFSQIRIEMNSSASEQKTHDTLLLLEAMVKDVEEDVVADFGQPMIENLYISQTSRTTAEVQAKLVDPELRPIGTFALSARWREKMPDIPGMKSLSIIDNVFDSGMNDGDVSFRIIGKDIDQLRLAARDIRDALNEIEGVYEIQDSEQQGVQEARFVLKPLAVSMGLTTAEVARQASFALYGVEAQRIVRDSEEIRVMVRYPEQERNVLDAIRDVIINAPNGSQVPLVELADFELADGVNQIYREDGNRTISIWATLDFAKVQPLTVANTLEDGVFETLELRYPAVTLEEAGSLKDERESVKNFMVNLGKILMMIFVLLALPLRSYVQPLMIMSVIPFGVIGAIWGHVIMGYDLSNLSLFGIFAAIGVVVNDSLVMVDYINKARERGETLNNAVLQGGRRRFRAVILTSLTTFIGLLPIMFESSLQAQIVIPMAISLAFGVLCATFVTLLLVPVLYLVMHDVGHVGRKTVGWFVPHRKAKHDISQT